MIRPRPVARVRLDSSSKAFLLRSPSSRESRTASAFPNLLANRAAMTKQSTTPPINVTANIEVPVTSLNISSVLGLAYVQPDYIDDLQQEGDNLVVSRPGRHRTDGGSQRYGLGQNSYNFVQVRKDPVHKNSYSGSPVVQEPFLNSRTSPLFIPTKETWTHPDDGNPMS